MVRVRVAKAGTCKAQGDCSKNPTNLSVLRLKEKRRLLGEDTKHRGLSLPPSPVGSATRLADRTPD